jgi:hypothetical protein
VLFPAVILKGYTISGIVLVGQQSSMYAMGYRTGLVGDGSGLQAPTAAFPSGFSFSG